MSKTILWAGAAAIAGAVAYRLWQQRNFNQLPPVTTPREGATEGFSIPPGALAFLIEV